MVDPIQLGSDILQNVAVLGTTPLLWLLVALVVWEDAPRARAAGLGRNAFWLLLPGALLGSFADLPLFGWTGNILAINLGGGAIPVLLSVSLLYRGVPGDGRFLATFLAGFTVQSGASFALLFLFPPTGVVLSAAVGLAIAAPAVVLALVALGEPRATFRLDLRRAAGLLALAGAALYLTFLTTEALPGFGIVSNFPDYLLAPVLIGLLAVLIAPGVFHLDRPVGLSLGYAAATFGVLVGADLLRQPPLYGGSNPQIYAIGGAGVLDLLYLSGLLALAVGYVALRVIESRRPVRRAAPEPSGPYPDGPDGPLRAALVAAQAGRSGEAIPLSAEAARAAARRARLLLGVAEPAAGTPTWTGLPAPPWVEADQQNLESLARAPPPDPREGVRAFLAGRWLVNFGQEIAGRRFGTLGRRVAAFLIDLVVLTLPAALVWYVLALASGSTLDAVLSNRPFNAAALGYVGIGFAYFVLGESAFSTTVGKYLLGLRVSDRRLRGASLLPILVRDLPKILPLWAVANTLAVAMAVVAVGTGLTGEAPGLATGGGFLPNVGIVLFLGVAAAAGVGLPGLVSVLFIRGSPERQRLGDLLAGTWVVRAGTPERVPAGAAVPSA